MSHPFFGIYDHGCLATVIKNTSGMKLDCSFLPPHGRSLAPDEEVSVVGDIFSAIARARNGTTRKIQAFLAALDHNLLSIIATPSPVITDVVSGNPRAMHLSGSTLTFVSPCWDSSLSVTSDPVRY